MKSYRIYTLNELRRIVHARVIEARNDREVVADLASFENAHGIEIWSGSRLVGLIEAETGRFHMGLSATG